MNKKRTLHAGEKLIGRLLPEPSLREQALLARGVKGRSGLRGFLERLAASAEAGRRKSLLYETADRALLFGLIGAGLALLLKNPFLIPALSGVGLIVPFLLASASASGREKALKAEAEAAASVITTAYIRLGDFPAAVAESLPYLKSPARELFSAFDEEVSVMNAGVGRALYHLERKVDDPSFREWCEQVSLCLEDRTLAGTLPPLVAKMNEERLIRRECEGDVRARSSEFLTLVLMTLGSIPLMKLLNKDWYRTLIGTVPGKITLGVCALILLWTSLRVRSLNEA